MTTPRSSKARVRAVRRPGQRGQTIPLLALAIVMVCGFAALAVDSTVDQGTAVRAQMAADAASLSAANAWSTEVTVGPPASRTDPAVLAALQVAGFDGALASSANVCTTSNTTGAAGQLDVTFYDVAPGACLSPPASARASVNVRIPPVGTIPAACVPAYVCVEVSVTKRTAQAFASVIGAANVTEKARSVSMPTRPILAWGWGELGQMGNGGAVIDNNLPRNVQGLSDFVNQVAEIGSGAGHMFALRTDGTVWGWGQDEAGQIGNNTCCNNVLAPVQVHGPGNVGMLTNIRHIAASCDNGYALKSDGTVWAWGTDGEGELGTGGFGGQSSVPVQVHGPGNVGFLTNVVELAPQCQGIEVLKGDGSVWGWGYNGDPTLGNNQPAPANPANAQPTPVQVVGPGGVGVMTNVRHLASVWYGSCVNRTDGSVWCWGNNYRGQIGQGSWNSPWKGGGQIGWQTPVQVHGVGNVGMLGNIDEVGVSGRETYYARASDGTVYTWGLNDLGEIGNNTTIPMPPPGVPGGGQWTPVQVHGVGNVGTLNNIVKTGGGAWMGTALTADGRMLSWGTNVAAGTATVTGQLGDGGSEQLSLVPVWVGGGSGQVRPLASAATTTRFKDIYPQGWASAAVSSQATMYSWGDNASGQLGDGTSTYRSYAVETQNVVDATSVQAAGGHSMVRMGDGTLFGWGANTSGEDGTNGCCGAVAAPTTPPAMGNVVGVGGAGRLSNVKQFYQGGGSSYALLADGTVRAWGANGNGQLGDNTNSQRSAPVQVQLDTGANLAGVISVAAGGTHALAMKWDGTVWSWGQNNAGELGDGTTTDRNGAVPVLSAAGTPLTNVKAIYAGAQVSYALKSDGTVVSWGSNSKGQLGINSTDALTHVYAANVVGGLSCVDHLATSSGANATGHTLAMLCDGTVKAWGDNSTGEIGDGTSTNRSAPVVVPTAPCDNTAGLGVKDITTGDAFSMALMTNGRVCAWGANGSGQLGDGSTTQRLTPAYVRALTVQPNGIATAAATDYLTGVTAFAAGTASAIALTPPVATSRWVG